MRVAKRRNAIEKLVRNRNLAELKAEFGGSSEHLMDAKIKRKRFSVYRVAEAVCPVGFDKRAVNTLSFAPVDPKTQRQRHRVQQENDSRYSTARQRKHM